MSVLSILCEYSKAVTDCSVSVHWLRWNSGGRSSCCLHHDVIYDSNCDINRRLVPVLPPSFFPSIRIPASRRLLAGYSLSSRYSLSGNPPLGAPRLTPPGFCSDLITFLSSSSSSFVLRSYDGLFLVTVFSLLCQKSTRAVRLLSY